MIPENCKECNFTYELHVNFKNFCAILQSPFARTAWIEIKDKPYIVITKNVAVREDGVD